MAAAGAMLVVASAWGGQASSAIGSTDSPSDNRRTVTPTPGARLAPFAEQAKVLDRLAASSARLLGAEPPQRVATLAVTTAPDVTVPVEGASVAGETPVEATSTAERVRFSSLGRLWYADVLDGVATSSLQTWGATGSQQLSAVDCDAEGCGSEADTVTFSVANEPVQVTQPVAGQELGSSAVVSVNAPGGSIRVWLDGSQALDLAVAPYQGTVETGGLAEGSHTITVTSCDSDYLLCDGQADSVEVTVRHSLSPEIVDLKPRIFSPNGDGRKETATVSYRLDTLQDVSWQIRDRLGEVVRGPVSLGSQKAGAHSLILNGKGRAGVRLSSGSYAFVLSTSKAVGGENLVGGAERSFAIDVRAPQIDRPKASPKVIYPVKDGYRDSITLRTYLNEDVTTLKARVRDSAGRIVRTLRLGSAPEGRRSVNWNGRRASGAVVAAGNYTVTFQAQDRAGNRRTSRPGALKVSAKRLVRHTGSQTVIPKANAIATAIGDCSVVAYPARTGWKGSLTHLSNFYLCLDPSDVDLLAFTRHQISVPKAVSYGRFRVSTYGGRSVPGFPDKGLVFYEDRYGDVSNWGGLLSPRTVWHGSDKVDGDKLVTSRDKFRWWGGTSNNWWYDIKSYRVTYAWFTLG
ncbi:hypothetical protein NOCA2570065 [metagenome]|uniref:FlgD/Vpr Ig-like domain-containing protein n=1 Tax=metagenome TaxID=256318 RepID=A0A2P2CB07_9ZZZZ